MYEKLLSLLKEAREEAMKVYDRDDEEQIAEFVAIWLEMNWVTIPVRCKDCKHYKFRKPYPSYNATVKTCCRCANTRVSEDDFCSLGERRTDV
jgi:hypothetical protein